MGRTSKGDVRHLLLVPAAADVAVIAWEPHLLQVGRAAGEALPQRRAEGIARVIEGEGLEGVFHLVRDLRVGEPPCVCVLARLVLTGKENRKGGTYWSADPRTPITGAGGIPRVPTVSHTASALILISVTPSW